MNGNISQHFRGYELFVKQLDEAVRRYNKNYIPQVYGFIGPEKIRIAASFLPDGTDYSLFGGYEEAFSKRLVIGSNLDEEDYIVCLHGRYNSNFFRLSHRDLLGAVYALQIDDSQFGDLWVAGDEIFMYTTVESKQFFIDNLKQVSKAGISLKELDYFPVQEFRFKDIQVVLSSYRLDRIIASIVRKSRDKAQHMISSGLINVNFQTIEDSDYLCHNNDILSVRGYGRFKIGAEMAKTKGGNVVVIIRQFI